MSPSRDRNVFRCETQCSEHGGYAFDSPVMGAWPPTLLTHLQYTSTAMRRTRHTKVKAETTIRGMIHSILPGEGRLIIPEVFFSATRQTPQLVDR